MANQRLTLVRLQKEERSLDKQTVPNMLVKRKGVLDFHFCVYGLDGDYQGGFYHGVLELTHDYPFSPPKLKFFTQSGRFQTNKPICTTFTNYHKQQWTSAWTIRTMLIAVVSFMTGSEGGNGSMNTSSLSKISYARKSLGRNMESQQFRQLFYDQLIQKKLISGNQTALETPKLHISAKENPPQNNSLYILFGLLFLVIIVYGFLKKQSQSAYESKTFDPSEI